MKRDLLSVAWLASWTLTALGLIKFLLDIPLATGQIIVEPKDPGSLSTLLFCSPVSVLIDLAIVSLFALAARRLGLMRESQP